MTPDEARAIINGRSQRGEHTKQRRTPEEAAIRARLASKAQSRSYVALHSLHKDEYDVLYRTTLADLLAEAGLS